MCAHVCIGVCICICVWSSVCLHMHMEFSDQYLLCLLSTLSFESFSLTLETCNLTKCLENQRHPL